MSEFHFLRPAWLLLIPVAAGLWWLVRQSQDPLKGWRLLIAPELLNSLCVDEQSKRSIWRSATLVVVWGLLAVAAAGPTWSLIPSPFDDDPPASMILLCVSDSMELSDLSPSRLERAKLKVTDLVEELKGTPLGLIVYAGTPHLVLPPTKDSGIVASMAQELSPAIMPKPGNDLASAIRLAESTLPESRGSIVVLSSNAPVVMEDLEIPTGIRMSWLAITQPDSPELSDIQDYCKRFGTRPVVLAPDQEDVDEIASQIRRTQIALASGEGSERWTEPGWWLLPIAALFALFGFRREGVVAE